MNTIPTEVIDALEHVRKTGIFNMFDRQGIVNFIDEEMNDTHVVKWLNENRSLYVEALNVLGERIGNERRENALQSASIERAEVKPMNTFKVGDKVQVKTLGFHNKPGMIVNETEVGWVVRLDDGIYPTTVKFLASELELVEIKSQQEVYDNMSFTDKLAYDAAQDNLDDTYESTPRAQQFYSDGLLIEQLQAELDKTRADIVTLTARNRQLMEAKGKQDAQIRAARKLIFNVIQHCTISDFGVDTLREALENLNESENEA